MNQTTKERLHSIDVLKGLSVFFMVFIHIPMALTVQADKFTLFYFILNNLAKISAPIFLFFVGFNLYLFLEKNEKKTTSIVKRGIYLTLIGLLFTFMWTPEIMHFIGFFILFLLPLIKRNKKTKLILSCIILFISPLLLLYFDYYTNWVSIPYIYNSIWTFSGFFKSLFINGTYAFFPWFIFPLMGSLFAQYFIDIRKPTKQKFETFYYKITVIALILIIISVGIKTFLKYNITFYPASIPFILLTLGITLLLFSFLFKELDMNKKASPPYTFMGFIGRVSLSFYIFHLFFGLIYFRIVGLYNTFSLNIAFLYAIIVVIVSAALCYIYYKKYNYGPLELFLRKLSS